MNTSFFRFSTFINTELRKNVLCLSVYIKINCNCQIIFFIKLFKSSAGLKVITENDCLKIRAS